MPELEFQSDAYMANSSPASISRAPGMGYAATKNAKTQALNFWAVWQVRLKAQTRHHMLPHLQSLSSPLDIRVEPQIGKMEV